MIYYDESSKNWKFHALQAMYTDSSTGEDVVRVEYVTERRYLEERVRQWPHLSNMEIRGLVPTPEQQARLNEINAANVEMQQEVYVTQYVQYGFIEAPLGENGVPVDTGHTYLNTLIGKDRNAERLLAFKRQQLRDKVAYRRWQHEIQGISINDLHIGTSDREKALLASKVVTAMNKPGASHKWKTAQGWVTLTSDVMIQLGLTVENFVQKCFDREGELVEAINLADDLSTIDLESGWPESSYTLDLSAV